jgi:hypothetical protein
LSEKSTTILGEEVQANTAELIGPVQTISEDVPCDPTIKLEGDGGPIHFFDFYPGSTDLVVIAKDDGVYVSEIDNRAWQNIQPLVLGEDLDARVGNGNIYIYDGELIYQLLLE